MRVIITGADGQLGRALMEGLSARRASVTALGRTCDITDPTSVARAIPASFDVWFNAAAATDVDRCEREPDWAFAVNAAAPEALARRCREAGGRFVHVSTDFVFSGAASRPYRESDPTSPLNVYGASKLEGEERVLSADRSALVVRTSWVFGVTGRNFLHTVLVRARRGEAVRAATDQVGSPTFAPDLAAGLIASVEGELSGLYHLANEGAASRWALARAALEAASLRADVVAEARLADFPAEAARPMCTALDCGLAASKNIRLRPWEPAVHEFVARLPAASDPLAAGLPAPQSSDGVRCED